MTIFETKKKEENLIELLLILLKNVNLISGWTAYESSS